MVDEELLALGARAGSLLTQRRETVGVAEGSCGGLVSAALLAVPGASRYYLGGGVIYTRQASVGFLAGAVEAPPGLRGASEPFVTYLARSVAVRLGADWGIGEGGATGPSGNPYGDPPGHVWTAVAGPGAAADMPVRTRHALTGVDVRTDNMTAFAKVALGLLVEALTAAEG